jgi:predicted nucleic acid-binding protein
VQIDEKISVLACDLIKNYRLSNGLDIPDAFIAATSIVYEIPLYTNNIKDFKFIKGIELFNQSSH